MACQVSIEDAESRLRDIIRQLSPGEELVITENKLPIAKLVGQQSSPKMSQRPGPGLCAGEITYMAPDFDAPLEEMKEYME